MKIYYLNKSLSIVFRIQKYGFIQQVQISFTQVIHSFIVMIQYRVIQKYLNKYSIILQLAIEMELVNNINIEQGLDQQQRQQQIQEQNDYQNQQLIGRLLLFDQRNIFVQKLSFELYEKLLDKFKCLKLLNKLLVLAFFFIELFALIMLLYSHSIFIVDRLFYYLCIVYMIIVVIFGLNQYFSTFTKVFLWIVFFPVFITYETYMWFKRRKEKKLEKMKILDSFKELLIDQNKYQLENNDCAICMQSFQAMEYISMYFIRIAQQIGQNQILIVLYVEKQVIEGN
ncbi:unnamed protein product (macronuclear) [Paramecium tetraurelia]|uniref:Transmembrane protein n=1 Tax=Paramecium tetraurelia TaxID=5888 RepID=A0CTJ3_PARTE|nr:uncharacterized protein GSPATT00010344001 [Paramecium tetraurelia]CAK74110.1 unnamed protein product [Paramecium tetraurelia]|eukprot:XP_001441507.1 hypothetical protein (macronuclear) [Paramecium tetraurelia strain d4-2]